MKTLNRRERQPVIFYVHPWEIDPEQPRFPVSQRNRFRHYRNLHRTEGRLRRLAREFEFAPVSALLPSLGLQSLPDQG